MPPELERLIGETTDGNPFFVEELTLSLLESGELVREDGGYAMARPVAALRLPTTVQGVLLARIDRLDDELKQLLQVASVIGRVFSAPVLAEMAEHRPDLEASCAGWRSWSSSMRRARRRRGASTRSSTC